jgi:hypothetical protein
MRIPTITVDMEMALGKVFPGSGRQDTTGTINGAKRNALTVRLVVRTIGLGYTASELLPQNYF